MSYAPGVAQRQERSSPPATSAKLASDTAPWDLVSIVAVLDRARLGSVLVEVPAATSGIVSPDQLHLASTAVPRQYGGDLAAFLRLTSASSPQAVQPATSLAVGLQNAGAVTRIANDSSTGSAVVTVSLFYEPMLRASLNQGSVGFPAAIGAAPAGYEPLFASDRAVIALVPLSGFAYDYVGSDVGEPRDGDRNSSKHRTQHGSLSGAHADAIVPAAMKHLAQSPMRIDLAERDAMRMAADAFYIAPHRPHAGESAARRFEDWRAARQGRSVDVGSEVEASPFPWYIGAIPRAGWFYDEGALAVNVAWTENDFEIDAAVEWGNGTSLLAHGDDPQHSY